MSAIRATRFANRTRRMCLAGVLVSLALAAGSRVASQGVQTIGGYQLVSEEALKGQSIRFTYRATLTNGGASISSATATITGNYPGGVKITDRTLTFGAVDAGGSAVSSDTFAVERKANSRFDLATLTWAITTATNRAPVANAGADLTRLVGQTAQLDGSASTDQDGNPLTYLWSFVSLPPGSGATLSSPTDVQPTFLVDEPGSYVIELVVNDGFTDSAADTVTVTTLNSPPVANAGPDQTALVQQPVTLNGSGSSDVDGNPLTFSWTLISRPAESNAVLANPDSVMPAFVVDRAGTYVVQLIVNDGFVNSTADTVSITTQNSPPVAQAGPDQSAFVTSQVTLDGSGSTDVDGDPLTYAWSLTSIPALSTATLDDPAAIRPAFVVDRPGTYVAQLIVDDGHATSAADTVTVTTENSSPVANAGLDQTAVAGQLVALDGAASTDADNDPLAFRWSLTAVPPGSTATLGSPDSVSSSFVVDRPGTFVAQLIVNDGFVDSNPDTITITTTNSTPVANAGPDQPGVLVGSLVTLDATQSSDPDAGQVVNYSWSLLSRPPTSNAALDDPASANPTFVADAAGDYVAQLIVSDGYVDSVPDTVLIHANSPPIADAGPDQLVTVGDTVNLDGGNSSDPDGSSLTYVWELMATPSGSAAALQGPTTAIPSFVADLAGDYSLQLTVTDADGAAATDAVTVTASMAPTVAPLITLHPADQSVPSGEDATFTASATGIPAPAVQWQFSADQGTTFTDIPNATSSVLTVVAQATDHGKRYRAVFTNVAGSATTTAATLSVTIAVDAVNEPITVSDAVIVNGAPMLAPLEDRTVDALVAVQFTAAAIDPGDTLIFTTEGAPAGAMIDAQTGAFNWTPTLVQAPGTYAFGVRVTDSGGLSALRPITITVRPYFHVIEESIVVSDTADAVPRPFINLESIDSNGSETGGEPATVRLSRTGEIDLALPAIVTIAIGGTASNGDDYQPIGATVIIPPDQAFVDLSVTPIDDAVVEGQESVVIAVVPGADYQPGVSPSATVTIADNELIVMNVNDSGPGSLRQAILDANGHAGTDTIVFDIPGAGPHTITPAAALPAITDPAIIDATTQPGAATEQPAIELDGSTAGPDANGLVVVAGNTTIRGLVINRFGAGGAGDGGSAIVLQGGGNNVVHASFIGTDPTGTSALPNRGAGVVIDQSSSNVIGDPAGQSQANTIAFNGGAGVSILGGSGNAIYANALFSNEGLAIDLGADGVTPNDPGDADDGPNHFQNFPVLTSALSSEGTTSIHGTLNGEPSTPFTVQLFVTAMCPTSGYGEGGAFLASQVVSTDAEGNLAFEVSLPISIETGHFITATATHVDGSTSEFSACEQVNKFIVVTPDAFGLTTRDSGTLTVTLSHPARAGGLIVDLSSGDVAVASVAPTVTVAEGEATATFVVTTGTTAGAATITAAAAGFTSGTSEAAVTLRTMTLSSPSPLVGVTTSFEGSITLERPAPSGGVTIALASSDSSFVAVSPPLVTIAEGDLTGSFTIAGIAGGTATISASAAGFATTTLEITATTSSLISLGASVVVSPGQSVGLPLSLGKPAPAGGVTVSLSTTDASVATVTPSVFIAEGLQIPAANPEVHGLALGSAYIVASATGFAPDTALVTVTLSSVLSPNPLNVIQGVTANATITLSSPAPAGGVTLNASIDDPTLATVPATVHVAAGSTTVPVPVTALVVGDTILRVSAPGVSEATIVVSVKVAPVITIGDATVGKDLQVAMSGTLGATAPAGNLDVTITSLDPDKILVATSPTVLGTPSLVVTIAAGSSNIPTFYLQALTATGTATIRTSATGYATDTSTITLRPSGFLLATGNLTTTTFSANSPIQVVSEYLTGGAPPYLSSGIRQAIRGGLSVDVSLTSSNTSVGRMVSSLNSASIDHVTFNGGDSARAAAFDPIGAGSAFISVGTPAGFEAASTGQQITATVNNSPAITVGNLTLGKDLQAALNGTLGAPAPAGNLEVTVRSLDPGSVLLSMTPTPPPGQPAGVASITLFVGAGSTFIPSFYVQALADSGAPLIEITAPDYATDTSTITLRPSGFLLATASIATTTFSSNSTIALLSQYLNPVGNPTTYVASGIQQALRAGLSVDVPLASSNTSVGTIVTGVSDSTPLDHVTFNGSDVSRAAAFDPIAGGSTVISITTPPGFSTATTGQQITATVSAPPITVANTTIGKDLQVAMNGTLGAAVPAGSSVIVTIRSLDPSKVLLSTTQTPAPGQPTGFTSITLTVGAGSNFIPTFYVQALTDSGTVDLETTAPGYTLDTSTITLRPSGFVLANSNLTTTSFSGNTQLTVSAQYLHPAATNPPTFLASGVPQALRAGLTVDVPIASSDPIVGDIVTSVSNFTLIDHLTFDGGTATRTAAFDPLTGGVTTISLTTPAGFTTATTGQHITATVTAPSIGVNNVTVGRDLQTTLSITLNAAPPSPVDVTVTSNSSSVTITRNGAVEGGSTVTFTGVTSTSVGNFVVQGRSVGNTTLTVRAPGYNDGTSSVTITPAGFYLQTSSVATSTFGPNRQITVGAAQLNPTTLQSGTPQALRGGLTVTVPIASSNTNVGTIVTNVANPTPVDHLSFTAGDTSKTVAFDPAGIVGTSTISIIAPSGFATPSNGQSITASVTTPDITVTSGATIGRDLQVLFSTSLTVAPPSGVDITVTSNDPAIARLTTVANKTLAGATSLTFNNVTSTSQLQFYVQGFGLGNTTLTVHASSGYDDAVSNITVNPSGFYIVTGNITTTVSAPIVAFSVGAALLDPVTLNFVSGQELRGGLSSIAPAVTSSNTSVGTIVGSPSFNGGDLTKSVAFDPATVGTSTISIATPTGFSTPSNRRTITATVNP